MYYRLSCITADGTPRGYQWRDITVNDFVNIATGQRLLGDSDAQLRNSPEVDATFDGSPVWYGHVWADGQGWVSNVDAATAEQLYNTVGRDSPGA
jgi:hypothetical protein